MPRRFRPFHPELTFDTERRVEALEGIVRDIRHGVRALRNSPGFVAVAVLSLALGIGVNTAIFSAVDAAVLRALPYGDPDRVVMVWEDASRIGLGKNWPSPGNFREWNGRNHVFAGLAALVSVSANLTADGPPEQVFGRRVTANFFSVMGVRPILGRTFTEEEERIGAPLAVVSYGLWQQRYAGDPNLAGKQILMDGSKVTMIGVLPREFALQRRDVSFWMPASFSASDLREPARALFVCGGASETRRDAASAHRKTCGQLPPRCRPNTRKTGAWECRSWP